MRSGALDGAGALTAALALAPVAAHADPGKQTTDDTWATPWAQRVPDSAFTPAADTTGTPACSLPDGRVSTFVHCYTPTLMRAAYGVVPPGVWRCQSIVSRRWGWRWRYRSPVLRACSS